MTEAVFNINADSAADATTARVRRVVDDAISSGRACLAFQPVMQARRPDTPAFHEGLIRLKDGNGRMIQARDFIDAVDGHEVGRRLDCTALELGMAELAADPALRLSINVSPHSLSHRGWRKTLDHGLSDDPTIGERLILEITEGAAISATPATVALMSRFQRRGVAFALDDFGAGCTSFRYFRDLRFDFVKIDGRFTRNIDTDRDNQAVMGALLSLGRHFEMVTVAECVETAAEMDWLSANGVDCLQGYHLGRPDIRPLARNSVHTQVA